MINPSLYFHTIRHLRPQQVFFRLLRNFNGRSSTQSVLNSIALYPLTPFAPWLNKPSQRDGGFTFLKLRKDFPGGTIDWRCMEMPKLWRYNLHYFDYCLDAERPLEDNCNLIDDWIANNPEGTLDAWEPYPASLRVVNWIKLFIKEGSGRVKPGWLKSTYQQALWLECNIEYHLLANHLFKNTKALVFAGLYFEGNDASRWLSKGLRLLDEQIVEQILRDGGHFERSPMYHAMILEDCLDLLNITHDRPDSRLVNIKKKLEKASDRMIRYLDGMCHPDGQIALFNDAAFGIEHPPRDLFDYYEGVTRKKVNRNEGRFWSFTETGYYVMAPKVGDRMIIDCGPVGPDYQLGHSHCDTLSFELSLNGRRVVVDSGCFQYEDGPIRQYNRGNVGHNTVIIDSENQSEVWGAHRCARRARPIYARLEQREDASLQFEGAHDGYKRLKGRPIHHRSVTWTDHGIFVEDRIEGSGTHDIESRLHIHPDLSVEQSEGAVHVGCEGIRLRTVSAAGQGKVGIGDGWYCPEFGLKYKCPVLILRFKSVSLPFKCGWKFDVL